MPKSSRWSVTATRRCIALPKHFARNSRRALVFFAAAFGVRARPRVALGAPRSLLPTSVTRPHLRTVETTLLEKPLFYVGHHCVTLLGLIAFVGFFAAGLVIARFLQSQ